MGPPFAFTFSETEEVFMGRKFGRELSSIIAYKIIIDFKIPVGAFQIPMIANDLNQTPSPVVVPVFSDKTKSQLDKFMPDFRIATVIFLKSQAGRFFRLEWRPRQRPVDRLIERQLRGYFDFVFHYLSLSISALVGTADRPLHRRADPGKPGMQQPTTISSVKFSFFNPLKNKAATSHTLIRIFRPKSRIPYIHFLSRGPVQEKPIDLFTFKSLHRTTKPFRAFRPRWSLYNSPQIAPGWTIAYRPYR
jgi:hypothetical protein